MLSYRILLFFAMVNLFGVDLIAQSRWDCLGAIPICGRDTINIISGSVENNDFNNPNNDRGCLETGEGSHSTWLYFEFRDDMPPDSELLMTLFPPDSTATWKEEDFDFAIYGPNLNCDSLGSPRRCSFARNLCAFCPYTGMGNDALDSQEDAFIDPFGVEVDGYVLPLIAQPGDRFYMLVTKFAGFSTEFAIDWDGDAVSYFNCISAPECINLVDAGQDRIFCTTVAVTTTLEPVISSASTEEAIIEWTGSTEALALLDNPNSLNPTVTIPAGFEGTLDFRINISQGICNRSDVVRISVNVGIAPTINQAEVVCLDTETTISVTDDYDTYMWSDGSEIPSIQAIAGQSYTITVSDNLACPRIASYEVQSHPVSEASIVNDGAVICGDTPAELKLSTQFQSYLWSTSESESMVLVYNPGIYSVTVTDVNQCEAVDSIEVLGFEEPVLDLGPDLFTCAGESITINSHLSSSQFQFQWSSEENTSSISITQPGIYVLNILDENGCQARDSIVVDFYSLPPFTVVGDLFLCNEGSTEVTAMPNTFQYEWSTGDIEPEITIAEAGDYSLTITDSNDCKDSLTFSVTQLEDPDAIFEPDQTVTCPGLPININNLSIDDEADYLWFLNDSLFSWEFNPPDLILFPEDGDSNYTVQLEVHNICGFDIEERNIYIGESPIAAFNFNIDPLPNLNGEVEFTNLSSNADRVLWDLGDGTQVTEDNPLHEFETENSLVTLYAYNDNQGLITCADSIQLLVQTGWLNIDSNVQSSNVITPNGDKLNDFFIIKELEENPDQYPSNRLTIMNQWGTIVWKVDNYQNNWEGTNRNNAPLPQATYYYLFEYGNGKELFGRVVILNK